ncbi:MAG: isoprenylcysteine carboxylmethyltransferase family protein [Phycisphaerae bacterium]|jgi:protein-S-isoprenylcysteine O-methyltransferase Ste14
MRATFSLIDESWLARNRPLIVEATARTLCAVFYTYFVYKAFLVFLSNHSLPITLLVVAETLTFVLIVSARFPRQVNRSLYPSVITIAASFYFLFVDLSRGVMLVPVSVIAFLQVLGIGLQIYAKIYLGRSFGLLPANRGVVKTGPYRVVRHPIYFGYFLNHLGFLLAMWSFYNLAVYVLLYALQFLRMNEEERLLMRDVEYREYTRAVPCRFIPLVL